MKAIIISFFLLITSLCFYHYGDTIHRAKDLIITYSDTIADIEAFRPHTKLLNKQIWTRVSANRFECEFLRLAVELKNNEYWLLEMDGNKRLLARHENYYIIAHVIVHLTLREKPFFEVSPEIL
jgi:hypothetical protein